MLSRALLLLVAACFLAGQLAAVPHAHGPGREHDSDRPHIHFWGGDQVDHHVREYRHVAHRDHAAAKDGLQDHDHDAVYLQPTLVASGDSAQGQVDVLQWQSSVLSTPLVTAASPVQGILCFAWCEPRPNSTGGHCALFLTLQTLRI